MFLVSVPFFQRITKENYSFTQTSKHLQDSLIFIDTVTMSHTVLNLPSMPLQLENIFNNLKFKKKLKSKLQ